MVELGLARRRTPVQPLNNLTHPPFNESTVSSASFLKETSGGTLLLVKLQPRASKNEIGEPLGDELKIKVTAPPVDAAANAALVKLLAEELDCARNRVELLRGHTSRHKTVKLHGFKPDEVISKLHCATNPAGAEQISGGSRQKK
jgi:hypothetical protein